jgi:proline iminopeptidase
MRTLYPPIDAYNTFMLDVGDGHTIYVEEAGNPQGKPVVFLHGGPGGGVDPDHRRYFDPKKWRIVLFDQRGCGKSTPFGSVENNTTWKLVSDIETIREKLAIPKWHVFGGSWGSTLALSYAESHPDRVKGLVLRGIFLLRKSEIDWFYQHGASELYPDAWEAYLAPIPKEERHDLLSAYHRRLTSSDAGVLSEAAKAWSIWEGSTSKLTPDLKMIEHFGDDRFSHAFARIECHYFTNNGFFERDGWLLENVDRIRHIKGIIVQGRYDLVCPMRSAWDLHRAWPNSTLEIIQNAGHAASEPATMDALIRATDTFANEND